jgi:hypothetical protein
LKKRLHTNLLFFKTYSWFDVFLTVHHSINLF